MNIDVGIARELSAQYFREFASSVGVSGSTGKDWTNLSSQEKGGELTSQVSVEAPPGKVVTVQQVVGRCDGDGVTKSETFKITQSGKDGKEEVIRLISNIYYFAHCCSSR